MRFLLDTNILSEPTRKQPDPGVLARLHEHEAEVATAAIVIHEMRHGILRLAPGRRREALADYMARLLAQPITVLAYDRRAALWHAEQRAALAAQGRPMPYVDGQIAAIAATRGLILVSRNEDDFRPYQGLRTQNWFG